MQWPVQLGRILGVHESLVVEKLPWLQLFAVRTVQHICLQEEVGVGQR